MGNFKNIETEFIERTLHLIAQYEGIIYNYPFHEQYNFTLLTNCLLGLIVLPKEKTISFLPKQVLNSDLKDQMGIVHSTFNPGINNLRELIIELRNSIAHFDIEFESENDQFLIDKIVFKDNIKAKDYIVAVFIPSELLSFVRYYGYWLIHNIQEYGSKKG